MSAILSIKNSSIAGRSPSSLALGELAINVLDGKIFVGDGSGVKLLSDISSSVQATGTVTSAGLTQGTGISLSGTNPITTSGSITVTNSDPGSAINLANGTGINITGTYPNLTITNTVNSSTFVTTSSFNTYTGSSTSQFAGTASYVSGAIFTSTNPALSASYAATASYALNAGGTPGGSNTQIQFNANSAFSGSPNFTFNSGSNTLTLTGSLNITGSTTQIGNQTITGSLTITQNISASSFTGSLQGTSSWATNIVSASNYVLNNQTSSFATTGSNNFVGNQTVTGSISISGSGIQAPLQVWSGSTSLLYVSSSGRIGISNNSPASQLQLNFNQNSVTQNDNNGFLLANSSLATVGLQSISPGLVWQGNGWKTNTTPASQDVRFRADVLPVQGTTNPNATWTLASSINGGAYVNRYQTSTAGTHTFYDASGTSLLTLNNTGTITMGNGQISSLASISAYSQLKSGTNTATAAYRTTNAGSDVTPTAFFGASETNTAGTLAYATDVTNGISFTAANGTRQIARAGINIASLTNTAGSESGDMTFLTQTGGTAMAERMRISGTGNLLINTTTDGTYKLDVNGTARVSTSVESPIIRGNTTASGTLTLQSTSNATKGKLLFGTSAYDEVNNRLGIGTTSPVYALDVNGTVNIVSGQQLLLAGASLTPGNRFTIGNTSAYKTTNAGSNLNGLMSLAANGGGAGQAALFYDFQNSNGLVFGAGNGTAQIARAGINIASLTNTAGSESGDMTFLTQTGGTAMAERMRIGSTGGTYTITSPRTWDGTGNYSLFSLGGTFPMRANSSAANYNPPVTIFPDGGTSAGGLGFAFDSGGTYGGLVFTAGNGSGIIRQIPRVVMKLTNLVNTNDTESADFTISSKTTGVLTSSLVERFRISGAGIVSITGSLNVTAGITGSFSGNGSGLTGVGGGYTVVSVSSTPYNADQTSGDIILLVDAATAGATTINLPTAVSNAAKFTIKKIDGGTNSVTVDSNGTETIDGGLTATLLIPSASITLISNNSNWFII